jgi:hypothetical protein
MKLADITRTGAIGAARDGTRTVVGDTPRRRVATPSFEMAQDLLIPRHLDAIGSVSGLGGSTAQAW